MSLELTNINYKQKGILVIGATGFLGIHIVRELCKKTNIIIYCFVRADSEEMAQNRINNLLEWYFREAKEDILHKIKVICGDITKDKLGLSDSTYENLGDSLAQVVHAGAIVKHFGMRADFERTNIDGCKKIIDLCKSFNLHLLYTSSVAVINYSDTSEENWTYQEEHKVDPYVWSKIKAEKMIISEMNAGLKCSIIRIGALFGRYSDGVFQKNISENAIYARIKTILVGGKIPQKFLTSHMELLPVDFCSEVIVHILLEGKKGILCLCNNNTITYFEFVKMVERIGYSIDIVDFTDFDSFSKAIEEYALKRELLTGFYFHFKRRRNNQAKPHKFNCEITTAYLEKNNLMLPRVTPEYLNKLILHMKKEGFIPNLIN